MIFDANKITCKECGSSAIRAEETVTRTIKITEWQLYKDRLYMYDYELDDEQELGEPHYFWCNDCGHKFPFADTEEHLNIKEEEE